MSEASQDPGANNPPPEATIKLRVDELITAADVWIKKVPTINDEPTAKAARDFIAQIALEEKVVEDERNRQRRPHLDANEAIQAIFKPMADRLTIASTKVRGILQTWLDSEKVRIKREQEEAEAKKKKAKAEAAAAFFAATAEDASVEQIAHANETAEVAKAATQQAAQAAKAKPILSGNVSGRALGERTTWSAEIADLVAAANYYAVANNPVVREAIQKAADADARTFKAKMVVPGCTPKSKSSI